jgi:hypothetical protein
MASQRFPKRRYLYQLRKMRDDLWWWAGSYYQAAQNTQPEWLQGRFIDRGRVLEAVMHDLQVVMEDLDGLPRLS